MAAVRFVTFVHRSPFATWNPFSAWCREQGGTPDEVVILHHPDVADHAAFVSEGVGVLLDHYGSSAPVSTHAVDSRSVAGWKETLLAQVAEDGRTVVDITPSRTVPKLAATQAFDGRSAVDLFYLDVADYRYEPRPFAWLPYNQQRIRHLLDEPADARPGVQRLPPPSGMPNGRVPPGATQTRPGRYECVVPWNALIVLLNEAFAAGEGGGRSQVVIKLPSIGYDPATYDLQSRTFRLRSLARLDEEVKRVGRGLSRVWAAELPRASYVETALAAARIIPFADQEAYLDLIHKAAWETRGVTQRASRPMLALDTNLFYFEFLTALAHTAKIPTARIPVVVSSISEDEIRHKRGKALPPGELPVALKDAGIHHALESRLARAAQEEFELFRQRCRMETVVDRASTANSYDNDGRILRDLATYSSRTGQEIVVLSSDDEFVERGAIEAPGIEVRRVRPAAPPEGAIRQVDVDQVAYFIFQLAIGFGRVNLKGLGITVYGDHPEDEEGAYAREEVRVVLTDKAWTRGFLHEVTLRRRLDDVLRAKNWWV